MTKFFHNIALENITSRIIPTDGWGNSFPSEISLGQEAFPKDNKVKKSEGYTLFRENHVTTLQTCQKDNIWWFKAMCDATQKAKKGPFKFLNF